MSIPFALFRLQTLPSCQLFNMEMARSILASILLRQIWPIIDHSCDPLLRREILTGFLVGPALRKSSKLSDVMRFNVGALGQTGHSSSGLRRPLNSWGGGGELGWGTNAGNSLRSWRFLALDSLCPTIPPFTLEHFRFSFLCLAVGSLFSMTAFVFELFMKQLLCTNKSIHET